MARIKLETRNLRVLDGVMMKLSICLLAGLATLAAIGPAGAQDDDMSSLADTGLAEFGLNCTLSTEEAEAELSASGFAKSEIDEDDRNADGEGYAADFEIDNDKTLRLQRVTSDFAGSYISNGRTVWRADYTVNGQGDSCDGATEHWNEVMGETQDRFGGLDVSLYKLSWLDWKKRAAVQLTLTKEIETSGTCNLHIHVHCPPRTRY